MTPAAELLFKIQEIGGRLSVLPEGQLLCERIPRRYESEITLHKDELIRLLQLPQPPPLLSRQELKNLVRRIEKASGYVRREPFQILLPDSLMTELYTVVIRNAAGLFALLPAARKSSSRPKRGCLICKANSGCRKRGYRGTGERCPRCNHWCGSHYLPTMGLDQSTGEMIELFTGGCKFRLFGCTCEGWPQPAKVPRRKGTTAPAATATEAEKGGTI